MYYVGDQGKEPSLEWSSWKALFQLGSGLTRKSCTCLERLAKDKHYLITFINFINLIQEHEGRREKVFWLGTSASWRARRCSEWRRRCPCRAAWPRRRRFPFLSQAVGWMLLTSTATCGGWRGRPRRVPASDPSRWFFSNGNRRRRHSAPAEAPTTRRNGWPGCPIRTPSQPEMIRRLAFNFCGSFTTMWEKEVSFLYKHCGRIVPQRL